MLAAGSGIKFKYSSRITNWLQLFHGAIQIHKTWSQVTHHQNRLRVSICQRPQPRSKVTKRYGCWTELTHMFKSFIVHPRRNRRNAWCIPKGLTRLSAMSAVMVKLFLWLNADDIAFSSISNTDKLGPFIQLDIHPVGHEAIHIFSKADRKSTSFC
jgi:hypothetical protein